MIARFLNYAVETRHDNSTEDSNLLRASTSTCLNLGENFEEEMRSNIRKLASNIIDESKWLVPPLQDLWSQILRIDHGRVGDDDSSSEDGKDNYGSEENNGGNNNRRSGIVGGLGGGGDNSNQGGGSSGGGAGGSSGGSTGGGAGGGAGGTSGGSSGGGAQKAIVKVEPGPSSGYWIRDGKNKTRIQEEVLQDAHLQKVRIEPRMSFEFMIDTDGIKTIQTSISVNFDLKGAMPDVSEKDRFGWFQREVTMSLKCSNPGGAKIDHSDRVLEEGESQKITFKENTQRTTGANQLSIGGKVGGSCHKAKLEAHGGFSKSTGTKAALQEHANEASTPQIPGGFCPVRLTSCSLSYKFFAPNYPTDITQVADERSRNAYMNSVIGSCATLCPKIMGSWYELREESDLYLYKFKAKRIVCELKSETNFLGQIKLDRQEFHQVYIVQIHVNHKMTHICKFKPRAFALKAGDIDECSDLLRVGEIHQ
jgi:hypothetical protein